MSSESKKKNLNIKTISGITLKLFDGAYWHIANLEQRKEISVYGSYTLEEWESILSTIQKQRKTA